jgi:hypothetical protein
MHLARRQLGWLAVTDGLRAPAVAMELIRGRPLHTGPDRARRSSGHERDHTRNKRRRRERELRAAARGTAESSIATRGASEGHPYPSLIRAITKLVHRHPCERWPSPSGTLYYLDTVA